MAISKIDAGVAYATLASLARFYETVGLLTTREALRIDMILADARRRNLEAHEPDQGGPT